MLKKIHITELTGTNSPARWLLSFEKPEFQGGETIEIDKKTAKELMFIKDLVEDIKFKRDRAAKDWEEDRRIAGHSAYGVGVDQGRIDVCDELLEEIKEFK